MSANSSVDSASAKVRVPYAPMGIAGCCILVAEDNVVQRMILVGILRSLGARQVLQATDGHSALQVLSQHRDDIDLIFSDLSMPGMDGLALIRHLVEQKFQGALILVSAHERSLISAAETMSKAYGMEVLGVVQKPATARAIQDLMLQPQLLANVQQADDGPSFTVNEIREGLAQGQFEPFFQPKIDVTSGAVVGTEALARWHHPQSGIIGPELFIPQMEGSGFVDQLSFAMLQQTAHFCMLCQQAGVATTAAVNLSLASLHDSRFADEVIKMVKQIGLDPSQLVFEVTETAAMTNVGVALENLTRLRINGFGLSIDDFGTGYSSIQQLSRISFTELKIDKSFVTNAAKNEVGKVILESSIAMARKLNIKPVAEGVESSQDLDLLRLLKCDIAQGYYFAKPMNPVTYLHWLTQPRTSLAY